MKRKRRYCRIVQELRRDLRIGLGSPARLLFSSYSLIGGNFSTRASRDPTQKNKGQKNNEDAINSRT